MPGCWLEWHTTLRAFWRWPTLGTPEDDTDASRKQPTGKGPNIGRAGTFCLVVQVKDKPPSEGDPYVLDRGPDADMSENPRYIATPMAVKALEGKWSKELLALQTDPRSEITCMGGQYEIGQLTGRLHFQLWVKCKSKRKNLCDTETKMTTPVFAAHMREIVKRVTGNNDWDMNVSTLHAGSSLAKLRAYSTKKETRAFGKEDLYWSLYNEPATLDNTRHESNATQMVGMALAGHSVYDITEYFG